MAATHEVTHKTPRGAGLPLPILARPAAPVWAPKDLLADLNAAGFPLKRLSCAICVPTPSPDGTISTWREVHGRKISTTWRPPNGRPRSRPFFTGESSSTAQPGVCLTSPPRSTSTDMGTRRPRRGHRDGGGASAPMNHVHVTAGNPDRPTRRSSPDAPRQAGRVGVRHQRVKQQVEAASRASGSSALRTWMCSRCSALASEWLGDLSLGGGDLTAIGSAHDHTSLSPPHDRCEARWRQLRLRLARDACGHRWRRSRPWRDRRERDRACPSNSQASRLSRRRPAAAMRAARCQDRRPGQSSRRRSWTRVSDQLDCTWTRSLRVPGDGLRDRTQHAAPREPSLGRVSVGGRCRRG